MNATKEEMEGLCKQVAELSTLAKKQNSELNETITGMVKEALATHQGFTPARTIEFPTTGMKFDREYREKAILSKMDKELVAQHDDMVLLSKLMRTSPKTLKSWGGFVQNLGDFKKALDTSASGGGTEWVPTEFSSQFYEMVRLETKVASLFPIITMPSNPYELPVELGRISTYKQAEQTGDTGQTKIPVGDGSAITGKTTLTAVAQAGRILTSKELEEDAIVPILPFIKMSLVKSLAEGREDCMLNGDTNATHEDSDIHALGATDRRKMYLGLRALANDQTYKTDLGTFNIGNMRGLRGSMGKYGVNPSRCALVVGVKGYIKLLSLAEVTTVDKYGSNATILNGELAKVDGMPVIVSEWIRENLDATGIYNVAGTKTVMHVVNRDAYVIGEKRPITTQLLSELYAESGQDALVATERHVFAPLFAIASNASTWMGYNIA